MFGRFESPELVLKKARVAFAVALVSIVVVAVGLVSLLLRYGFTTQLVALHALVLLFFTYNLLTFRRTMRLYA